MIVNPYPNPPSLTHINVKLLNLNEKNLIYKEIRHIAFTSKIIHFNQISYHIVTLAKPIESDKKKETRRGNFLGISKIL